jgi:hypothetical protein
MLGLLLDFTPIFIKHPLQSRLKLNYKPKKFVKDIFVHLLTVQQMKLKLTSQLLLIDLVLQLLPVAYFAFSSPSFAENSLNGPLVQAAFYLFLIWKISTGSNMARYLFLAYTLVIFLPLSIVFLMQNGSVGMALLVVIQLGIRAYCLYQLFFTPTKLAFNKVEEESEFPKF